MTEIKYFCDHCGVELVLKDDYDDCTIDLPTRCLNADLCADCTLKLSKLVCEFLNRDS